MFVVVPWPLNKCGPSIFSMLRGGVGDGRFRLTRMNSVLLQYYTSFSPNCSISIFSLVFIYFDNNNNNGKTTTQKLFLPVISSSSMSSSSSPSSSSSSPSSSAFEESLVPNQDLDDPLLLDINRNISTRKYIYI